MTLKAIDANHAATLNIDDLLAYIIEVYGIHIYLSSKKLAELLSDLWQTDEKTKRIYKHAILNDNISKKLHFIHMFREGDEANISSLIELFAVNNDYTKEFSESIIMHFSNALKKHYAYIIIYVVKLGLKYGILDQNHREITQLKYDEIISDFDGFFRMKLNDKWGFIDRFGHEITPIRYDEVDNFTNGLAPVQINDKWGFLDKKGKEIIPLKYDEVNNFILGLASVQLNGKWGFINEIGNEVIPFKYDGIDIACIDVPNL